MIECILKLVFTPLEIALCWPRNTCPECDGFGTLEGSSNGFPKCQRCNGSGKYFDWRKRSPYDRD